MPRGSHLRITIVALFKFRRENSTGASYLTPGYPVTPIVFLVMLVVLLVLLAGNNPMQAFLGVWVVSLGFPVYLLLYRNKRLVERWTSE
jgi:APA family basic amino acid/polyamine antiporter